MLKIPCKIQTRHDGQLVHPFVPDPIEVKNILPVVNIGTAKCELKFRVLSCSPCFFRSNIKTMVVRKPALVKRTIKHT